MKKLSLLSLASLLLISLIPNTLATTDYSQGTQVEYVGLGSESYTITVPALLTPGSSGTVTLSGTWADNRIVSVTANKTVELTNSINTNDKKILDISFTGIKEAGSNTGAQTFYETVSVSSINNALFGTWNGHFNYNVDINTAAIEPGLYQTDSDYGVMLASWDELIENDVLFVDNGVLYTAYDDEEWTNLSADELVGDLMLPADGSITQLGDFNEENYEGRYAFYCCWDLTGICIPSGVTVISDYAFSGCNDLKTINIPNTVTYIGNMGMGSTAIKTLNMEENSQLSYIGDYALSSSKLEEVFIPATVTHFGEKVFYNCKNLKTATFESDSPIKELPTSTFEECQAMTTAILPDGLEVIGTYAFQNCYNLAECTIPDKVETIQRAAFYHAGLTSIVIPDSVTTLENQAFFWNTKAETLHIGAGLTEIPSSAFDSIYIETLIIPEGVTSIGNEAFYDAYNLKSVSLPSTLITIEEAAFARCDSLETVSFAENSQLKTIGDSCFTYDEKLQTITIPQSITSIGSSAFRGCKGLKTVIFETGCTLSRLESGIFRDCIMLESVAVPAGVGTIESEAFYNCSALTYVFLPSSTNYIYSGIFYGCTNLTSIEFGGTAYTWQYINKSGWKNNSAITEVRCSDQTIPA